jgi:hypothetical protein
MRGRKREGWEGKGRERKKEGRRESVIF